MKKSLLLLTTLLTFNMSTLSAAEGVADSAAAGGVALGEVAVVVNSAAPASRPAASATDLDRIKAHILGYAGKFGLPEEVETVGSTGCFACCSTTFDAVQRDLLNKLAGQLLTRFLALALDDLADGRLDGIAYGKKISYSQEIASLLGVEISEEELRATTPLDASLLERVGRFAIDVSGLILTHGATKDGLLAAAGAFAQTKMDRARKSLAVALVRESDRIIRLELGNGKIDGLDEGGMVIDWKKEMATSIRNSLSIVVDGVL